MATLTFQTLRFMDHNDCLHVTFMKYYSFVLAHEALRRIGTFHVHENSITFPNVSEKRAHHKFYLLLEEGFQNLYGKLTRKKTIYVHQNSGIPLLGTRFIGILDRGTNFLEIKPITGCTMGCTFCSVDEGIGSKKNYDVIVERDYLVNETQKLLAYKNCKNMHLYINVHGEPLLYSEIVLLVEDLKRLPWVQDITIITTAILLTEDMVDALAAAGLTELNVSISADDVTVAKQVMGNPAYSLAAIKKIVAYASQKLGITITPVWMDGINDEEMEKIIAFGKEVDCTVRIQKFCYNKFGRNPVEEISWEEFFKKIEELEKKTGVQLKEKGEKYTLEKTMEYPVPFKRREIIEAAIVSSGRYFHEKLCFARDRLISVPMCKAQQGKIKIKILKTKNNIIVGEEL